MSIFDLLVFLQGGYVIIVLTNKREPMKRHWRRIVCLSSILSTCHVLPDQVESAAAAVGSTEFVGLRRMIFNRHVLLKETLGVQKPFQASNFCHCALHVSAGCIFSREEIRRGHCGSHENVT